MSNYADSKDKELAVGDRIRVSTEKAVTTYGGYPDFTTIRGRKFDVGTVEQLNEDGTVGVYWDSAGCSCDSGEPRSEVTSELTFVSEDDENLISLATDVAYDDGYKESQQQLASALGLSDNTKELAALQERLELLESKNN